MKKGEVATILTIGTVVLLGIATMVSSLFLSRGQNQTLNSKASEPITQSCNGACSNPNSFCVTCMNPREKQTCATGAGVALVSKCENNQWKFNYPECRTECKPEAGNSDNQNTNNNNSANDNGCFKLSADFEVKDDSRGKAFFASVNIMSQKGGDVQLEGSGAGPNSHLAGWNKFGGGTYTYNPSWTQSWAGGSNVAVATFNKVRTVNVNYTGYLSSCNPQSQSVNCSLTVDDNGAKVSGTGCNCKSGCGSNQTPTNTPTQTKPSPTVTTGISPTPTLTPAPGVSAGAPTATTAVLQPTVFNDIFKVEVTSVYKTSVKNILTTVCENDETEIVQRFCQKLIDEMKINNNVDCTKICQILK